LTKNNSIAAPNEEGFVIKRHGLGMNESGRPWVLVGATFFFLAISESSEYSTDMRIYHRLNRSIMLSDGLDFDLNASLG
jgi:hypothetical protein